MFLNRNETFLTSFVLDDLLNRLVAGVYEKRPVSSREVLELMSETLESTKMKQWYYSETVRSFKSTVDALNRRGFPMQMTCPLYFRVPLEDGGVDELFPSGSQVAVTPNNYDTFGIMLKQYYRYRSNPDAGGSYYDAARRFLPINVHRNLLNLSFLPVLKLVSEHLLNPDSPWCVRSEEEWAQLGVTYAVPLAGRFFPVDPTKPAMTSVPFAEASRYVELASDTVNKLNNLLKTGAALNAFRLTSTAAPPQPLHPPSAATSPECDVATRLSPLPPQQQQRQQTTASRVTHSFNEFAELESIGLRRETCQNMTAAELSFWDYILQLRRNPTLTQDVSFRLEFGGGKYIDLEANGAFIPVTKYNVAQFFEAAVQQQDEVHRYINGIASTTTMATTSSALAAAGVSPGEAGTRRSSLPMLPPPPGGTVRTARRTRTAAMATDPDSTSAGESVAWNETRLRRSDVDSAVVRSMLGLRVLYHENRLTAADVGGQSLRFCIPCAEGVYNLIPNGREIRVGLRNFGEFMLRLEEEKRRVEADGAGGLGDVVLPVEDNDKGDADAESFWTDRSVLEIWTYEVTTDLLARSGLPPEEVVLQTSLKWDTNFLRNADDPQRVMSGPRGEILPGQLTNYLALLHRRLQTIRLAILDARRCSRQPSDGDSYDLGTAELAAAAVVDVVPNTATPTFYTPHQPRPVPPPPTEADLNMLFPTHNTGGLLAPPQSFNH